MSLSAASESPRLDAFGRSVELQRWPPGHTSLRAWDGADRLLLAAMAPTLGEGGPVLLANDAFGALAVPLALAGNRVIVVQDGFCEQKALQQNCARNAVPDGSVTVLSPLQTAAESPRRVVIKAPKDLQQIPLLLHASAAAPGTPVWVAGMDKHLPREFMDRLAPWLDKVERQPGRFKAHVYTGVLKGGLPDRLTLSQSVSGLPELALTAWPGVFARRHADPGGRFLCDNLPPPGGGRVADLGCGNGMVGLSYARKDPLAEVWFCDSSALAVDSAQRSAAQSLGPEGDSRCRFHWGDGLDAVAGRFDRILLNPPFHHGHAVDQTLGEHLIRSAASRLAEDGELHLVINRHLDYRRAFRSAGLAVRRVASNAKFLVLCATRVAATEA